MFPFGGARYTPHRPHIVLITWEGGILCNSPCLTCYIPLPSTLEEEFGRKEEDGRRRRKMPALVVLPSCSLLPHCVGFTSVLPPRL